MTVSAAPGTSVHTSVQGSVATLHLKGSFDFSSHRAFREFLARSVSHPSVRELRVDLSDVRHMNSSALGLLLLGLEQAQASKKTMSLCGVGGIVKQTLDTANFSDFFAYA